MNDIQWKIFAYIVAQVETPLVAAVTQVMNAFLALIASPLKVALVLYIALTGVLILRGEAGEAGATLIGRFLRMGLVVWVLTGTGVYQQTVFDFFFTTLPQTLAGALTSSGGANAVSANSFDQVWITAWRGGLEVWRTLGWRDVAEKLVVVVFWIAAIVSTVFAFAIWLISHVLLALYIAIGPLLVALALFPATRAVFERWIGSLISCVILQITTVVLLFIVLAVEQQVVGQVVAMGSIDPMAMMQVLLAGMIFFAVATFVAFQMPGLATSLAGGLHFHSGAVGRAMSNTLGSIGSRQIDGQGNVHRTGRSGGLGMAAVTAAVVSAGVSAGVKLTGRALGRGIRRSPGGSLSDGR